MSAFGYGSSYSFKNGDFNPGFTQGMGQDPRQIVSKSGIDSIQKGGMPSQQAAMPTLNGMNGPANAADPYGVDFKAMAPNTDPGGLRLSMDGGSSDPFWDLAYSSLGSPGLNPFNESSFTGADVSSNYQKAYNQLTFDKSRAPQMAGRYDTQITALQNRYQQWLNQMLKGGSFGLSGGGLSYGQRQGGV